MGNSISPTANWGVQAGYAVIPNLQLLTGVGFGTASSFKIKLETRYVFLKESLFSPLVSFSYNYLLPNSKDYGEGLNEKENFRYSAAHFLNGRAGLNLNITKISKREINNQVDAYILAGYSKRISSYKITPADPISYEQKYFDSIDKDLFTSALSFNLGIIVRINRKDDQ